MRFTFDNQQLAYLDEKMGQLAAAVKQPEFATSREQKFYRTACKMKSKFTPNASIVYLGGPERRLLYQMLEYRLKALADTHAPSDEMALVQLLLDLLAEAEAS